MAAAAASSSSDASDRVTSSSNSNNSSQRPSYVGLSKAVSGYSAFNRYDDDGSGEGGYSRRKKSSLGIGPNQIPVASEPQTLDHSEIIGLRDGSDSMRQITTHVVASSSNGHDATDRAASSNNSYSFVSSSSTVKYHYSSPNSRGDSPMSSEKTLSPESNSAGNLVQKQIERLYGPSRTASTEDERIITSPINGNGGEHNNNSSSNSSTPQRKNSGGFFAKRFGLSRQKDRHTANDSKILEERDARSNGNNPLEVKQLKVPAVFRLLRPEFREQLKSSSCQIPGDQTTTPSPTKKKMTPPSGATVARESIVASKERVIPIQRSDGNVVKMTNGNSNSNNDDAVPVSSRLVQQDLNTPKRGAERVIPIAVSPPKPRERVIPIQRSPERLLDSITPPTKSEVKPIEEQPSLLDNASHEVTSAALVASTMKEQRNSIPEVEEEEEEEEVVVEQDEVEDPYEGVGGVHECAPVLTTIMEEDEKSTAGSQLNLKAASRQNSQVDENVSKVEGQEVKDGHYFIRVRMTYLYDNIV